MTNKIEIEQHYYFSKILCRLISTIGRRLNFKGARFLIRRIAQLIVGKRHILIETELKGNIKMKLDLEDDLQLGLFTFGKSDPNEILFIKSFLKKGDVFLDIGANIGYFTLVASKCVGNNGKVIAFEANSTIVAFLEQNIIINNCSNVTVNHAAVTNSEGIVTISLPPQSCHGGWGTLATSGEYANWPKADVQTTTVDSYLKKHNIHHVNMIKIDIEGSEVMALKGMEKLLSSVENPFIICEVNPFDLKANGNNVLELENLFSQYRYKPYQFHHNRLRRVNISHDSNYTENYIFCK